MQKIGMSLGMSPAVQSLGLGGLLDQQVKTDTDEERRRRIKEAQERSVMGTTGTAATMALFGGSGGLGY